MERMLNKKNVFRLALTAGLMQLSIFLLKDDASIFLRWWLMALLLGLFALPVTSRLFQGFEDRGWVFSKVLAVALDGFLTWFLVAAGILPFTTVTCVGVTAVLAAGSGFYFWKQKKNGCHLLKGINTDLIFWEEFLFFAFFLLWTYIAGFNPAAYGTEKFMDYGFMESMMRSTTLPPKDLWYSQGTLNYYYGGQYFAVFLTKITGGRVEETYNLMRMFVAGLAFAMPFSITYQMLKDKCKGMKETSYLAGITAGLAVSIAGNMHYIVYGVAIPMAKALKEGKLYYVSNYWFPDATRYIGFNPDVPDKTIHEFPCYSFVLGDLHAHVVNIMFVLCVIGVLYAWMQQVRVKKKEDVIRLKPVEESPRVFWKRQLFMPHILLCAMFLGMFQWTNFWDYVIYFVVTGGVVLFSNIIQFQGKWKRIVAVTAGQAVEVLLIAYVVILPFTLKFDTMFQGVSFAKNHSLPHQLLILWGLPIFACICFLISVWNERIKGKRNHGIYKFMSRIDTPDLFAVILSLCAMGLILIPELVYIRDIYGSTSARANTMFKLTYQAYMMFGITMGYVIFRIFLVPKEKLLKFFAGACLFFLVSTFDYFAVSVQSWCGDVKDPSGYEGLDATAFLEKEFPEDADAIHWLKENIEGSPVVLEVNGDSYTEYERVSAMTGLPTILGWRTHEWLWRDDTSDLDRKAADIEDIYTSHSEKEVKKLLKKYDVSYIVVGSTERKSFGEDLNESLLKGLGEVVFQDAKSPTYILKISK